MNYHLVYLTTNLITGKQYIGDHSTNNLNDGYLGSGDCLISSIKKHGRKNFKREILENFEIKQKAFNAQEKYIIQYNTLVPAGYNISPKGGHNVKDCISEETKRKIGNKNKGNMGIINAMKTRIVSEETRKNMSNSRLGKSPSNKGIKCSEETKQNMSKSKMGLYTGDKNPMYGKSPYDIWIKKYGVEEADKMKKEFYKVRTQNLKECEFCHKIVPLNIYNRCHGKKCKYVA